MNASTGQFKVFQNVQEETGIEELSSGAELSFQQYELHKLENQVYLFADNVKNASTEGSLYACLTFLMVVLMVIVIVYAVLGENSILTYGERGCEITFHGI